ncbi:MAG: DUF885 domain-containing protein [Gemmatimonadetes bacterium]|nr:DUF885 domain-containing protein [Gemmatimonadota bacterium]
MDRFFDSYYRLRPVNATFTGVHRHDHQLPDWSPEGLERATDEMVGLRDEFSKRQPNEGDTADTVLADAFLEIQIAEVAGTHFQRRNPALYTGEAVFSVLSLMLGRFADPKQRAEAVLSRLQAIPQFLRDARLTLRDRDMPDSWKTRATAECGGAVSLFDGGLANWCREEGLGGTLPDALSDAGSAARAALEDFRTWLVSVPDSERKAAGCGPDFFDLLLQRGHWCNRSRHDLLAEATELLADAEARLNDIAQAAAPGGGGGGGGWGWKEVQCLLGELHPPAADYLGLYERTWHACQRLAAEKELVTWPDLPVRYVEIPRWARASVPALYFLHYRSPAPFDDIPVTDYLVTPIDVTMDSPVQNDLLRANNESVIKLNHVVHHGGIGHHTQNFHAYRSKSRIGQVSAVDCASRIGMFCGGSLAEGWACYATDLMEEVGFLTELESVAEQHSRVRQLTRAIVDIELHQHDMDHQEARAFYETRAGMPPDAAHKEVTRNSMFPGTAVMYWLGTQGIHDLRAQYRRREGATFSLRQFHDALLSFGSIPVALIAELMMQGRGR